MIPCPRSWGYTVSADEQNLDEARELKDLDVHEVSLVDAPAIRRRFAVVKRLEGETVGETTDVEKAFRVNPKKDFPGAPADESWSFTAEEGNEILGEVMDWEAYSSVHLISDPDNFETKDGHKTPVAKKYEGQIRYFRSGLNAAIQTLSGARGGVTGVSQEVVAAAIERARSIRDDVFGEETEGSEQTKKDEEGAVGDENTNEVETFDVESEVVKQALPMLTALANEKMSALVDSVTKIQDALTAGTLTKEDANDMFRGLSSLLWRTEDDVLVIAKSLDVPVVDVDKARRMTRRRLEELKAARDSINSLLSELEDEVMSEENTQKTGDGTGEDTQVSDATTIEKTVTDAVTAAVAPLTERIGKLEEKAGITKSEGGEGDDKDDVAKIVEAAVAKALEPVTQRLDQLEANPGSEESDETTKIEKNEDPEPGTARFWSGAI